MERGDVAEADEQLGIGADDVEIEMRQHPRRAPAAAHREDRADFGIGEHRVDRGGARLVRAGEIAVAAENVGRHARHQPHRANRLQNEIEIETIGGEASRLDQADNVAPPQPRGAAPRGQRRRGDGGKREQGRAQRLDHIAATQHRAAITKRPGRSRGIRA